MSVSSADMLLKTQIIKKIREYTLLLRPCALFYIGRSVSVFSCSVYSFCVGLSYIRVLIKRQC